MLANDFDAEGPLTLTEVVSITPSNAGTASIVNNKIVFTAASTFTGSATILYQAEDTQGQQFATPGTLTIEVQPLPTSIHAEISAANTTIYPNPTNGSFDIRYNDRMLDDNEIKLILDANSNRVGTRTTDISHLPAGTYRVSVLTYDKKYGRLTIVKQ
ncbi:MAG: Ig-like domain-containing protein [Candidatus Peribacteria bacterium]|nr:MAG: Ig-like domain-containing protein [Candidatus Peribacteria bacterium]